MNTILSINGEIDTEQKPSLMKIESEIKKEYDRLESDTIVENEIQDHDKNCEIQFQQRANL